MASSSASDVAGKRKATAGAGTDCCPVCLEDFSETSAKFVGPCKHVFHVECAEQNFIIGRSTVCPCCRAEFVNAPGFVAMARAGARASLSPSVAGLAAMAMGVPRSPRRGALAGRMLSMNGFASARSSVPPAMAGVMPDVAPAAPAAAAAPAALVPGFARASVQLDRSSLTPGAVTRVTALVSVRFADDDDASPVHVPTDFVLLGDVSGSMNSDGKFEGMRDALLLMSDMFGPGDRVALVAFDDRCVQLTPLSPLGEADHEARFRAASMAMMQGRGGGTSIAAAMRSAMAILDARVFVNPMAQVMLLTDGQDYEMKGMPAESMAATMASARVRPVWSSLGFGADHDAELLSTLSSRGGGTFTYHGGAEALDETLSAFVSDATRVLAVDVSAALAPAPGVSIVRVRGPGANTEGAGGLVSVALGVAPVAGVRELLVEMDVEAPVDDATVQLLSITVSGVAPGTSAAPVATPPLAVSLVKVTVAEAAAAEEAIATASNRECLATAAAAIAANLSLTSNVVAAAQTMLRGSPSARAPVEAELLTMRSASERNDRTLSAFASATAAAAGNQVTLTPQATYVSPSKGSTRGTHRMACKKMHSSS